MIVKVSKSGNGIVVVDDFGNTYVTSKTYLMSMVSGRMKAPFVQMTRMPVPADIGRFTPSPILAKGGHKVEYEADEWSPPQCSHNVEITKNNDAGMSQMQIKKRQEKEMFEDIVL